MKEDIISEKWTCDLCHQSKTIRSCGSMPDGWKKISVVTGYRDLCKECALHWDVIVVSATRKIHIVGNSFSDVDYIGTLERFINSNEKELLIKAKRTGKGHNHIYPDPCAFRKIIDRRGLSNIVQSNQVTVDGILCARLKKVK